MPRTVLEAGVNKAVSSVLVNLAAIGGTRLGFRGICGVTASPDTLP